MLSSVYSLRVCVLTVKDARDELTKEHERSQQQRSESSLRLADELAKNATMGLDMKALSRQAAKLRDECEASRSQWVTAQSRLHELSSECESLRDHLKQKDLVVLASHYSTTAK